MSNITNSLTSSKKAVLAVATISVLFGVMVGLSVQFSDAQGLTEKRTGPMSPQSFGARTAGIVCGDRLCSEPETNFDNEMEASDIQILESEDDTTPHAELIDIKSFRPSTNKADAITYRITFTVTAGTSNLADIRVEASSDIDSVSMNIGALSALSTSTNVIRIKALDPDSIDGGITSYRLTAPTGEGIDRFAQP